MSPSRASVVVSLAALALVLSGCAERSSPSAVSSAKEAPQQQTTPSPQGPPAPLDQPKASEPQPAPTAGPLTDMDELKVTRAPAARAAAPSANKRVEASSNGAALSPEIIRRVVRLGYPEVHACYETGLKQNPTLQGRMTVKLVISKEGATRASVATSDLPDKNVAACVTKAFASLSFPPPDHGEVTVNYPVAFSPTAAAPD